jgi:ABC-type nickel/cobalt efflux system permease component RcnA/ABC-type uncharacterized transport system substrate-binding protein
MVTAFPSRSPPPRRGPIAALAFRIVAALAMLLPPAIAAAHPHIWIDSASEILFDKQDRIVGIRHHWRFDEAFSAYAVQGLDADRDGTYSRAELEPLARENVESLAEFYFFTELTVGTYLAGFDDPQDYYLDMLDGHLVLHFTLPLAQPFRARGSVLLSVFDPEYYVSFAMPGPGAVRLVNAPEVCVITVNPAVAPDSATAALLGMIGADQRELPDSLRTLTSGLRNSARMSCSGSSPPPPEGTGQESADLVAGAPDPDAGHGLTEVLPPSRHNGWAARLIALQAAFNRDVVAALRGLKDGGGFWWLGGISFLYGIVHAAGPGHGKIVISSYLVAGRGNVRQGIFLSFLAALAQALVAIGIIGVMAVLLNMTSTRITATAGILETASFAAIAGLGAYLLFRKGRQAWATFRGAPVEDHAHAHDHEHDHAHHGHFHGHGHHNPAVGAACAHDHIALPSDERRGAHDHIALPSDERRGLSGAVATVLSVGLRPCSGALIVLVFALAQGAFWAGVASTFLMAAGTAITVAALAALTLGARDLALRLTRSDSGRAAGIMLGLELTAALFITALGLALLAGAVSA